MAAPEKGMPTVDGLKAAIAEGSIDTVISAICNMQGRLVGKRITGEHVVNHCLNAGRVEQTAYNIGATTWERHRHLERG